MNRGKEIFMILGFVLFILGTNAQGTNNDLQLTILKPYSISVGYTKTSNIIFPFKVLSVDRGSSNIMVQKGKGAENILQIKAARAYFKETNLTVVTADGKLFSFLVNYSDAPDSLNILIRRDTINDNALSLLSDKTNCSILNIEALKVRKSRSFLHAQIRDQGLRFRLQGIFLGQQTMWFTLELKNSSFLDFTPTHLSFYIKNRSRSKRTALQEQVCRPIYSESLPTIKGKTKKELLVAFEPFSLPDTKKLEIILSDQNSSRVLKLKISSRLLLKAKPIGE